MGFVMLRKTVYCSIATPFLMIPYGKNAFWASVNHVINAEVAVPQFDHTAKTASQPSVNPGGLVSAS